MFGLDTSSLLLMIGVALVVFLLLDLLLAGGGMTGCVTGGIGSMMGGVSSMMGTPWGWVLLLAIAAPFVLRLLQSGLG